MLVTAQAALAAGEGQIALDHLPETFLRQIPEEILEAAQSVPIPVRPLAAAETRPPAAEKPAPPGSEVHTTLQQIYSNAEAALPIVMRSEDAEPHIGPGGEPPAAEGSEDAWDGTETLPPRVRHLLGRLNAQAELLSRQLAGVQRTPPPPSILLELPKEDIGAGARAWVELEERLDRGVDRVLALRRQMAALNARRHHAIEGLRSLLERLSAGFEGASRPFDPAEATREAEELIRQLDGMDSVIQQISERLPELVRQGQGDPPSP